MTVERSGGLSDTGAMLAIVLAVLAVHMTALLLPYYFVDDVWLYHYPAAGFPDLHDIVAIKQGRPVMALIAMGMRAVRGRLGVDSMLVIRAVGAAGVMTFACLVYRCYRLWMPPLLALVLALLLVTLPSFQMYVSAAPLFGPSLAYCGFVVLVAARFMLRDENAARHWTTLVAATLGLLLVWATYQATPLVVFGLLTPLLLSSKWAANPRWKRLASFVFLVGLSLAIYYAGWRLASTDVTPDDRYSAQVRSFYLPGNWAQYSKLRFPQVFGYWDTRASAHLYFWPTAAIVVIGCAIDLAQAAHRRWGRAGMWMLAAAAIVAVDLPVLLAPPSNTFTYMTSAPSAAATFLLTASAAVILLAWMAGKVPRLLRAAGAVALLVCTAGVVLAARNVAVNHAVPNWLEYALVRDQLRREVATGGGISAVTVYTRGGLLGQEGAAEFQWSNFEAAFWAQWAVRNILDELGVNSNVRIDVVEAGGAVSTTKEALQAADFVQPGSGHPVTIDLRAMNLREPPGSAFRESVPLQGMPPVPPGLVVLPIDGIQSTLAFQGHGARGEKAVIDGDPSTSAADPGGFSAHTSISLHLKAPGEVSAVRVLTAKDYGVALWSTLKVDCVDAGTPRTLGTIAVKPGVGVASQAIWNTPCVTQAVHLEAVPPTNSANFWLSEVQVLGRTTK